MQPPRDIVFDIETSPLPKEELDIYAEKFPKKPKARTYKLDAPALYWTTGQVACVGMKWNEDEEVVICTGDEYDTLNEAHEVMKNYQDTFIGFNSIDFDAKFLTGRAWKHLIPMKLPISKYAKNHIDIYQILGGSYGSTKVSLAELAHHFGVDDAHWGHGAMVADWWTNKEYNNIIKHCRGDIISTYRIYTGFIKPMYRGF